MSLTSRKLTRAVSAQAEPAQRGAMSRADGETAKGGHGGEAGFQSDAVGLRA
jgi:hypothetical protein